MTNSTNCRFFISDLPANSKESDLERIFCNYGEIEKVELKCKENLVDPDDVKIIAFVTLKVDKNQAQYCLRELNRQKIHGQHIKVALAKESFLERLQREREAAAGASGGANVQKLAQETNYQQDHHQPSNLFTASSGLNKRKVFGDDDNNDDDAVAAEDDDSSQLNICKKSARNSLYNGRLVIQSNGFVKPLHIIASSKQNVKGDKVSNELNNDERLADDQKRRQTLAKRKQDHHYKKNLINESLKQLDVAKGAPIAKITRFNDDDDDSNTVRKTQLFNDDDNDNDYVDTNSLGKSLSLKGKKAAKLLKMQSKQSNDPRFRLDEKFLDEKTTVDCVEEKPVTENGSEERDWQLRIMEQVVGVQLTGPSPPVDSKNSVNGIKCKEKNMVNMLRYDPTNDTHTQYEKIDPDDEKQNNCTVSEKVTTIVKKEEAAKETEVSKEVFYMVTDTLKEALRNRGKEQFSLLNMFNSFDQHLEKRDEHLKSLAEEKILVNDGRNNQLLDELVGGNPFKYDSSSSEEEDEIMSHNVEETSTKSKLKPSQNNKKVAKVATEKFFFNRKDQRLKEGMQFFFYVGKESADGTVPNYDVVRENLKKLIKTKIAKSKKQMTKAGYKNHKMRKRQGKQRRI